MNKDKDFVLQQLKAKSSVDVIQKYKIKKMTASKRRKKSISNQGKSQQPIGSIQKKSICHETSHQITQNIAQQKWRNPAGLVSFARIRGRMIKLQDSVSSSQSSSETFQTVVGKKKPRRVRCLGRTTTTILKRNEEIAEIKKAHANKVKQMKEAHANEMNKLIEENQIFMQRMEEKFQLFLNIVLNQSNSRLNMEALAALFSTPPDDNSAPRSSASTHASYNHEEINEGIDEGPDDMYKRMKRRLEDI